MQILKGNKIEPLLSCLSELMYMFTGKIKFQHKNSQKCYHTCILFERFFKRYISARRTMNRKEVNVIR